MREIGIAAGSALDDGLAGQLMRLTLGHIDREWPHKLDQVLNANSDLVIPRALHPIFFGSLWINRARRAQRSK